MTILINDFDRIVLDKLLQLEKSQSKILTEEELRLHFKQDIMMDAILEILKVVEDRLNSKLYLVLKQVSKNVVFVNVMLIVSLGVFTSLLWELFVKSFDSRISYAKLVFLMIPVNLISKNTKIKRFLNQTCSTIVIN